MRYLPRPSVANVLANHAARLGTSGLKISKVILGMMSYGSPEWQSWVLDEKESLPLLKHAYDVGINTWDTVGFSPFFPETTRLP